MHCVLCQTSEFAFIHTAVVVLVTDILTLFRHPCHQSLTNGTAFKTASVLNVSVQLDEHAHIPVAVQCAVRMHGYVS